MIKETLTYRLNSLAVYLYPEKDANQVLKDKATLFSADIPNIDSLSDQLYDAFSQFLKDNKIYLGVGTFSVFGSVSFNAFDLNHHKYDTPEKIESLISTLKEFPEVANKYMGNLN